MTANIFHMDASYFGTERTKNPEAEVGSVDSCSFTKTGVAEY